MVLPRNLIGQSPRLFGGTSVSVPQIKRNVEIDIAQSRYFTVSIEGINTTVNGDNYFEQALPLKNLQFTMSSIDTMPVSVGIIKELPIPTGIKIPRAMLTLLDSDMCTIEKNVMDWYHECVPYNNKEGYLGYVGYLSKMVRLMSYDSYTVSGKKFNSYKIFVIPVGDFSTTREYDGSDFKQMNLEVALLSAFESDSTQRLGVRGKINL